MSKHSHNSRLRPHSNDPNAKGRSTDHFGMGPFSEVAREVARKHYEKAAALCRKYEELNPEFVNARGVCLMRLGKFDAAVSLFRGLVLQPGCVWIRESCAVHFKTNFATALLLTGHPRGCLDILSEGGVKNTPTATKLRASIRRWESTLSLWQWLDWKLSHVAPKQCAITLDFEPGEFGVEIQHMDPGTGNDPGLNPRQAA